MADLTTYRLAFRDGFHIGTRGVNVEESGVVLPSDTLFAALVAAFRRTGGDPDALVAPFLEAEARDVPFRLTSTYPYAGEVRFYPMPVPLQRWFTAETLRTRRKELKRIRFLSEALWGDVLAGRRLDERLYPEEARAEPSDGVALQGGVLWLTADEADSLPEALAPGHTALRALRSRKVYAREQVPRVTIDRLTSASEIYHFGRAAFAPGCGLWFGIEWRRPEAMAGDGGRTYQQTVEGTLAVLEDDGLGGGRSVGRGTFRWKNGAPLSMPDPGNGAAMVLLSRYHPRAKELPAALGGAAGYALTSVGGWLHTWDGAAQRRKRLWLVEAGSVVRAVGDGPWGDVVDVRPTYANPAGDVPHPVWRYGLGLGARLEGEGP